MQDFEKLGVFYLGRPYDAAARQAKPGTLLYDSKDLVTHAVCFGMTGSGKTGLCVSLLEEAAIDGIPAIVIDPKGDLGNLLLTFPGLSAEDFEPWINEDEARVKGIAPREYAARQAELWRNGLASWGQDGDRIRRFREAADIAVYTPGSKAGLTVSVLKSFDAPPPGIVEDDELLGDRVSATATALLGLLGVEADPLRSREHILVATILSNAWKKGENLDLTALIGQVQTPPIARVGVMDLEMFYPAKERFALAMSLNNLLASPGFEAWLEGDALDAGRMLYTPEGRPRLSIFSIAHLNDAERMFFVSMLLNQVLSWMRGQSGTTSLRALLYMDEIFGYFPPVANPPSKQPLLTLLKQARAFGLGVVLATQNPVDLDYKGLANAGTWFIGRLQTDRDKQRVLDGLEGATASAGGEFDRQGLERVLSQLGNRVFLMNNVHEDAPEVFETRWALSYLRGPLTRAQIKTLMAPRKSIEPAAPPSSVPVQAEQVFPGPAASRSATRPVVPPGVDQYFIPVRVSAGEDVVYRPVLVGSAEVRFVDSKAGIDMSRELAFLTPVRDDALPVNWEGATEPEIAPRDLEREPVEDARFEALPAPAAKPASYKTWQRDFSNWLYGSQSLDLFRSAALRQTSKADESERDFRIRLQQTAREQRDQQAAGLRTRYAPKIAALEEKIRRAEQAVARENEQAGQQKMQTAISIGATLLGAFLGRKAASIGTVGRAATAVRSYSRTRKESHDAALAAESLDVLKEQLAGLQAQFDAETQTLGSALDPMVETLETVSIKPKKANITIRLVALTWAPYRKDAQGNLAAAWE